MQPGPGRRERVVIAVAACVEAGRPGTDDLGRETVRQSTGVLFFDKVSTAPPAVQAALLGVVLERTVGDLELPEAVSVVAAANPPEQAADGWDLSAPLGNRFSPVARHRCGGGHRRRGGPVALRPRPDVIIVLTDGRTPWPAAAPRGSRVGVGIIGDGSIPDDVPHWVRTMAIDLAE